MKLSKRLEVILDTIPPCEVLLDIGSDHALLSAKAILTGKVKRAIAADISYSCVKKAEKCAELYGLRDKLRCVQSDGFKSIDENADVCVIAGMGALEIIAILEGAKSRGKKCGHYVLSPHTDVFLLRKYLLKENFLLEKDFVTEDGKFYDIMLAKTGGTEKYDYSEREIYFGRNVPSTDAFNKRLEYRKGVLTAIAKNAEGKMSDDIKKELEAVRSYEDKRHN